MARKDLKIAGHKFAYSVGDDLDIVLEYLSSKNIIYSDVIRECLLVRKIGFRFGQERKVYRMVDR